MKHMVAMLHAARQHTGTKISALPLIRAARAGVVFPSQNHDQRLYQDCALWIVFESAAVLAARRGSAIQKTLHECANAAYNCAVHRLTNFRSAVLPSPENLNRAISTIMRGSTEEDRISAYQTVEMRFLFGIDIHPCHENLYGIPKTGVAYQPI